MATRWSRPKTPKFASPNRVSLFDQAERAKQQGIEASYQHADSYWKNAARQALRQVCESRLEFTTNDIWDILDQQGITTGENRAIGAIMQSASRAGMIQKTGNYRESRRTSQHKQPIAIWRSNLYKRS